ncbi:MAG: integrase core domain-containing protein [Thermoplasmatales archaeon]
MENALLMAFKGTVSIGTVLGEDNGPQYLSSELRRSMKILGIRLEYIQKHTPEDNWDTASFHNPIRTDYIWHGEFRDFHDASITIWKVYCDYNECRPHSSIDYIPPGGFRKKSLNDPVFSKIFKKKEVKVTVDEN